MPVNLGSRIFKRAVLHRTAWLEGVRLVPCVVVDISSGGAQLGIPEEIPLSDTFSIRLTADGRVRRKCRLVWRRSGRAGVRFD